MQMEQPPVTMETKAANNMEVPGRGNKRIRAAAGEDTQEEIPQSRSWKDTVMESPLFAGMFRSSSRMEEENDDDIPTVEISADTKNEIRQPWRKALIIKGEFECIDLGNGFYAVKFQSMSDRLKVPTEGPWKIMDHYLTVQKWKLNFLEEKANVSYTAMWIHISGLPIEYFDEKILAEIGKLIGTTLYLLPMWNGGASNFNMSLEVHGKLSVRRNGWRGVGSTEFTTNCRDLIREENPVIISLLENKAKEGAGNSLQKKLRFENNFEVPASHRFKGKNALVAGDFNDFASLDEREGNNTDCIDRIIQFRERWDRCNLLDVGWTGNKFTWTRRIHGQVVLQERLDRALLNTDILIMFPNIHTTSLTRLHSDHNPILINTNMDYMVNKNKIRIRFEAA
ncbi:hypothetical protein F3Y22_tig00110503pilonHSYRG00797 [Hibiscus syriacus]|uniref:DUF4283 domain-containing protein n=1 Tax=Hibiscus syriacus TaxID=106335 RepID=A0A6A3AC50_HIBSY|nr:hypothetical protein F3Y22_tig00110503pilonHSYRG00797 [Hibiscus syriacus]